MSTRDWAYSIASQIFSRYDLAKCDVADVAALIREAYAAQPRPGIQARAEASEGSQLMRYERVNGQRIAVYDNGKSGDRYTVVYLDSPEGYNLYHCVGMSGAPFWPQGVCQHGLAKLGRHLGKRIPFATLPEDCRKVVERETQEAICE